MKYLILYSLIDGAWASLTLGYLFVALIVELTDNGSIHRAERRKPGGGYYPIVYDLHPKSVDSFNAKVIPAKGFPHDPTP
jgi:hypothetical protein